MHVQFLSIYDKYIYFKILKHFDMPLLVLLVERKHTSMSNRTHFREWSSPFYLKLNLKFKICALNGVHDVNINTSFNKFK
jgi:hypothetical protein